MKIGWLSPSGELFELQGGEHLWGARILLEKMGYTNEIYRPDDFLMSLGYVHITYSLMYTKTLRIHWNRSLTPEQIRFLRPYFEQTEISIESWDLERFQKEENY